MAFPYDIPTSKMSPPQFTSLNNNDFKREGTSHSNPLICPPPRMTLPQSNRSDHIFYKTRICTKFRFGACRNGNNCNFAHGAEEIRQPPPNSQKLVGPCNDDRLQLENRAEYQKIIQRMKLCKHYCNGEECPYGDKCIFLHEDPAQFRNEYSLKSRECFAITIETNNLEGSRNVNKQARGTYRKTKLCRNWKETGYCSYGKNCLFAHGEEELQVPGGAIEADAAVAIEAEAAVAIAKEEHQPTKKRILGLKFSQINRIYGDWIDD